MKMNALIILFSLIFSFSIQTYLPEKQFSIEITPLMPTNETLVQSFRCGYESHLKELNYWKYFPTKISCNDWSYKKMNTSFNITIDGRYDTLLLNNIDTISAHVNGHLILIQRGLINDGICAGGKFDKLVFNRVDDNACDEDGVKLQTTIYGSVKIDGGYCQALCVGDVLVEFSPGIKNL